MAIIGTHSAFMLGMIHTPPQSRANLMRPMSHRRRNRPLAFIMGSCIKPQMPGVGGAFARFKGGICGRCSFMPGVGTPVQTGVSRKSKLTSSISFYDASVTLTLDASGTRIINSTTAGDDAPRSALQILAKDSTWLRFASRLTAILCAFVPTHRCLVPPTNCHQLRNATLGLRWNMQSL